MADQPPMRYAVVEYATARHFLNVYAALPIERIAFEVVRYDRERHMHLERASAYLPITSVKLICHQILTGQARSQTWKKEIFGGSERDGQIESRVFRLEYDTGTGSYAGKFAQFPFRITITTGPGRRTETGGIAPTGEPAVSVSMRLPDDDISGICLEIRDYLLAHQRELESVRRAEQQKRFATRQQEPAAKPASNGQRPVASRAS